MLDIGVLTTQKNDLVEHPHLCTTLYANKVRSPASSIASPEQMSRAEGLWGQTTAAPADCSV